MKKSFVFPDNIINWMEKAKKKYGTDTEIVLTAIRLFMRLDYEKVKEIAWRTGLKEESVIRVAIHQIDKMPLEDVLKTIIEVFSERQKELTVPKSRKIFPFMADLSASLKEKLDEHGGTNLSQKQIEKMINDFVTDKPIYEDGKLIYRDGRIIPVDESDDPIE